MQPYPHQVKVYNLLADRKNVILRAPTGAGKTQAAIYPFLAAMDAHSDMHHNLPHKCLYSVPMRVLAKQFHAEYKRVVHRYNARYDIEIQTAIQTGDMPYDRELTQDLIFATIDQTLSSFLMAPYGLPRGRANLNLGAVLSSYLVFDEFHLYNPDSTLPTTLQMLRMLNGIAPFVLMTATFSDVLVQDLADKLNAEVVGLSDSDRAAFAALGSQQKTRRYHARQQPLTPDAVLDTHIGRSIVICNTVKRARQMAARLRERTNNNTDIILLHSQFLREDRDEIEDRLRAQFGKNSDNNGSLIVVATQAIEVGVDITSTAMHTELAPANAIIQRAGRCARYEGDTGDVYIYRYVLDDDGEPLDLYEKTNPYSGRLQKPQIPATFEAFTDVSGAVLNYHGEQAIIDTVHSDADRDVLRDLNADSVGHRRSMFAAMRGEADHVGELVRKVIAQPVTIHDAPQTEAVMQNPYRLPSFNLHPGTLRGYVADWLTRWQTMPDDEAPRVAVQYLKADADPDNSAETLYSWEPVHDTNDVPYGTLVVVHPALATYSAEWGFLPEQGGNTVLEPPERENKQYDPHTYKLETYAEHIRLVYKAAFQNDPKIGHTAYWHELDWAAHRLAERLQLPYADIRQAAELTVQLHDIGKLSIGWQQWVQNYQTAIGEPVEQDEAYAHTQLQTDEHREIARRMRRRPPHAVQSAVAATHTVAQALPEVLRQAVFTAISRHHGAFTANYEHFRLSELATEQVARTMDGQTPLLLDGEQVKQVSEQTYIIAKDTTTNAFFAYALLVRLLRRSDVKGTIWGSSAAQTGKPNA